METTPQKAPIRPWVAQTRPITAPITKTTISPAACSLVMTLRSSHRAGPVKAPAHPLPARLEHLPELEKHVRGAIHLGKRTLRVIGKRDDDADQPPVLVVEDDD